MSKKKKKNKYIIIDQSRGSVWRCGEHEDREPKYVVHHNYRETSEFIGKEEQALKVEKFNKICDELFLCELCWETEWYLNDTRYDDGGNADFTSLEINEYKGKEFTHLSDI